MTGYCENCKYKSMPSIRKSFKENETVFLEGAPLDKTFLVEKGIVKVSKIYYNGEEKIFEIVGPGEFLALVALLKEDQEYIASATTLSDVTLLEMDKFDVLNAYKNDLSFREVCVTCLMNRTNLFQSQLANILNEDIEERIIHVLTFLSTKFGIKKNDEHIMKLPISKTMLAGLVGVRRETLSRKLSKLKKEGKIDFEKNVYKFKEM